MDRPQIQVSEVVYLPGFGEVGKGRLCSHPCDVAAPEDPHECHHSELQIIAAGPTYAQYELLLCVLCGCRTWADLRACDPHEDGEFWVSLLEWREPA